MICYKDRSIDISMLEGQGWECVSTLKDKVTYVYAKDNQKIGQFAQQKKLEEWS